MPKTFHQGESVDDFTKSALGTLRL